MYIVKKKLYPTGYDANADNIIESEIEFSRKMDAVKYVSEQYNAMVDLYEDDHREYYNIAGINGKDIYTKEKIEGGVFPYDYRMTDALFDGWFVYVEWKITEIKGGNANE